MSSGSHIRHQQCLMIGKPIAPKLHYKVVDVFGSKYLTNNNIKYEFDKNKIEDNKASIDKFLLKEIKKVPNNNINIKQSSNFNMSKVIKTFDIENSYSYNGQNKSNKRLNSDLYYNTTTKNISVYDRIIKAKMRMENNNDKNNFLFTSSVNSVHKCFCLSP